MWSLFVWPSSPSLFVVTDGAKQYALDFSFGHDFARKPDSTFLDHGLVSQHGCGFGRKAQPHLLIETDRALDTAGIGDGRPHQRSVTDAELVDRHAAEIADI